MPSKHISGILFPSQKKLFWDICFLFYDGKITKYFYIDNDV